MCTDLFQLSKFNFICHSNHQPFKCSTLCCDSAVLTLWLGLEKVCLGSVATKLYKSCWFTPLNTELRTEQWSLAWLSNHQINTVFNL